MEVSVVVPVYNAIQYIEAAVNSILAVSEVAEVVCVVFCITILEM
ncbi:MAG: glycosyltransferase [Flavobacteriales bacterium]|nr:glycosyltransferase [Flavobacteriales bacterium]